MAERCHICRYEDQGAVTTYICLKCHKSVCKYCYFKHFIEGNNHVPDFKKTSFGICSLHTLYTDTYCFECDEVLCFKCLTRNHKQHKHDYLERIAPTLVNSKTQAVKKDLEVSKQTVQKLDLKVKKRQKIWEVFVKEVVSIETLLDKQCKQIGGLFFRKKEEIHEIVHGENNDVAVFLKQKRNLKVARTIEYEKHKTLSELYAMAKYKTSKEFVLRYIQFRNDVQNCVTYPQPVLEGEIPQLKLNYDHHSISQIEEVLPCIWFG